MAALRVAAAVKVNPVLSSGISGAQTDGATHVTMMNSGHASPAVSLRKSNIVGSVVGLSGSWLKLPVNSRKLRVSRPAAAGGNFRASASPEDSVAKTDVAPLSPVSAIGQFLATLIQSHPHLLHSAVDAQLERMSEEQEAAASQDAGTSGTELVLYKRIAEMKAEERRKAVEETMYALIVHKFISCGAPLVPKLPETAGKEGSVIIVGPPKEKELESVHSPEGLEMAKEHVTMVLGGKSTSDWVDQHIVAQISKLRVGQVYAASIMFGYFLRRVDARFQLEKTMKGMSPVEVNEETEVEAAAEAVSGDALAAEAAAAVASLAAGKSNGNASSILQVIGKPCKLRSYVMSFDSATLQASATMRTREGLNLIERHAEALFGKPDITMGPDGTLVLAKDDTIRINFSGLRRLVLEAIAFGSFLWDVESYVDSQYPLIAPQGSS